MTYSLNSFFPIPVILNFNCVAIHRSISVVSVVQCECTITLAVTIEMTHNSVFCAIVSGWVRHAGCGTICAAVVRADSSSHSAEESTARPPRASSRLCVTWSVTQPGKEVTPIGCLP